jgi:hypothetical protein
MDLMNMEGLNIINSFDTGYFFSLLSELKPAPVALFASLVSSVGLAYQIWKTQKWNRTKATKM